MPVPCLRTKSNAIADGCVERDMDYGEGGPTYRVHFAVTYGGCPARISGPPEDCWPAEGPEWEITGVDYEQWNGIEYDWIAIEQTHEKHEIDAIYTWAENLDLSEDAAEATTDMQELYAEQEAESRRDPLE